MSTDNTPIGGPWEGSIKNLGNFPMTADQMLDWLEVQAKKSPTGISFDYVNHVEEGRVLDRGFRFMRRFFIGEPQKTLRDAIKEAVQEQVKFAP
jgi:hypothetical protein